MRRTQAETAIWEKVEPSIEGYSRLIQRLLDELSDSTVKRIAQEMTSRPDEEATI